MRARPDQIQDVSPQQATVVPIRQDGPQLVSALMNPIEVSEYLGVPTGTLANWRYQGRGTMFIRVGRHVRYRAGDLEEWIDRQASSEHRASHDRQRRSAFTTRRRVR